MRWAMLFLVGCGGGVEAPAVELRWIQGRPDRTWDQARDGLRWQLANLGAVPAASEPYLDVLERSPTEVRFALDVDELGLSPSAVTALEDVEAALAATDQPVDLGRFLMATLYTPWRYYAITGACTDFDDWADENLYGEVGSFAVVDSLLTEGERIIGFHEDFSGHHDLGMTVTTGEGSLADGSFVPVAREALDVMANGMQRFAIYSLDGHLEPAAEEAWVPAGQPGKCMWCHEGHLQGVVEQPTVPPHLPHAAFAAALEEMQGLMSGRRAAIGLDPNGYEAHSWGEQLVQEFNRPSVERVAREWGVAVDEVRSLSLPDEVDPEYPDLGPLLWRRDVDAAAGGHVLAVLPDPRELDPADVDWEAMAALPGCL